MLQGVSIHNKRNNNEDDDIKTTFTTTLSSLRSEKSQRRKLSMNDSDGTQQQIGCQDRNGTFYVDIIDKKKDCLWLSQNTDRFEYLCRYLQVAHKCRKLCKACHYFPLDDNDSDSNNNSTGTTIIVDDATTEDDDDDGDPLISGSPPSEVVLNPGNTTTGDLTNQTEIPGFGVVVCFPGNVMVQKLIDDKTTKIIRMEELKFGDVVRVAEDEYSRVYSFGHYQRDGKIPYLQVHHQLSQQKQAMPPPLELSEEHMVYVIRQNEKEGSFVPARSILTGDTLLWASSSHSSVKKNEQDQYYMTKVRKINYVWRKGAYAPFTESGTILVNDILASNYVSMFLQQSGLDLPVTEQWLYHSFQAPQRLICSKLSHLCTNETYNEETGISVWLEAPFQFFQQYFPSTTRREIRITTLQLLMMIPIFALISGICNILDIVLPPATENDINWVTFAFQFLLPLLVTAAYAYVRPKKS